MNLIVLDEADFIAATQVRLVGRRHLHLVNILKVQIGTKLSVGRLNGNIGRAEVVSIDSASTLLEVQPLTEPPPANLPLIMILGLPRPKMLQRTLQTIATMGVAKLYLLHTDRVEKSFWQTPLLQTQSVREQLLIGLEQSKATQLPEVEYHRNFRDFFRDILPQEPATRRLIAHPGDFPYPTAAEAEPTLLAIGPEGGFIATEFAQFVAAGFAPVQLGPRILRVETAVPVLLAKLF